MATVEELEEQIFNTITSLRNNKKQPNKGTICCITSKFQTTKSLNKVALQGTLNKLAHCKNLKEKQYSEKKIMKKNKDQVNENVKDLFTSDHETPLPQDNIETPKRRILLINEVENKTDEVYCLHIYVQSSAKED